MILTITGDARGSCGALDTDETTVTVVEAPQIEHRRPRPGRRRHADPFDAALVGDLDVGGATFAWDFGDGTTATGPTVTHAFAEPAPPRSSSAPSSPAPAKAAARSRPGGSSR